MASMDSLVGLSEDAMVDAFGGAAAKKKLKPGSFQGLNLSRGMFKSIMRMGYNVPTPIQRKTIPTIMDGQDVVAMARTGSGKTAAFIIPILERLKEHSPAVGFRAIMLSPTRELAMQTARFFFQLAKHTDLRCCLLVGGQAMEAQFEHLANNPDVIVATPGRLAHHISEVGLSLSRVEVMVFDEADRLFELGFAEQLQTTLQATPLSRQVLLFSATLPSQLVSFSRAGLKDPVFVRLDVETTLSETLDLQYLYVRKEEKIAAAIYMLKRLNRQRKSTIMFVATRHHVEFFGELLRRLEIDVSMVYGAMDQDNRNEQIGRFRGRKTGVLVTTDVAARGLDVPLLDHVLNFDFPPSGKLFVHRAGRTARAGKSGLAISLVTLDDLPYTVELMLFLGRKLRVADGTAMADAPKSEPVLGTIPPLICDVETLQSLIQDEGSDLQASHKSMISSYSLYYKTRPSASKQSTARAKQLLEECGGPARMQSLLHPTFVKEINQGKSYEASQDTRITPEDFIQELRAFRPKEEQKGSALTAAVIRTMHLAKADAHAVSALKMKPGLDCLLTGVVERKRAMAMANAEQFLADELGQTAKVEEGKRKSGGTKRRLAEAAAQGPLERRGAPADRPRMSKAARKTGHSGKVGARGDDDFDGLDVCVDGVQLSGGAGNAKEESGGLEQQPGSKGGKKNAYQGQFFLSTDRDAQEEAKERGLDMEKYQMDLLPDEGSDIQKAKSVKRWDAKKKKYLPVMIAVDGRAVKKTSVRTESGRLLKDGESVTTNIYKRWVRTTKKRIQKTGEYEQGYEKPLKRIHGMIVQEKPKNAEGGEDGSAGGKDNSHLLPNRKSLTGLTGEIPDQFLTNKQKRIQKRRSKLDSVIMSKGAKQEVRSGVDLAKQRRDKAKRDIRHNPKKRLESRLKKREQRTQAADDKQMRSARTRSQMLVFKGPRRVRGGGNRSGQPTGFKNSI